MRPGWPQHLPTPAGQAGPQGLGTALLAALVETLAAYAELIAEGKVRAIGASNFTAPRLAEALAEALAVSTARACRATRPCSRSTT